MTIIFGSTSSLYGRENEENLELYKPVFDLYLRAKSEQWGVMEAFDQGCIWGISSDDCGYAFMDLNSDGITEMLVGNIDPHPENSQAAAFFLDLYTISNGEPLRVIQNSENAGYFLCADGTLLKDASWGNDLMFSHYRLPASGSFVEYIDGVEYLSSVRQYVYRDDQLITSEGSAITEEEFEGYRQNFEFREITYIPFEADRDLAGDVPETGADLSAVRETEEEPAVLLSELVPVCQYPELPTGCEMTSLAMVLNYWGVDTDKEELSDVYLAKGEVGTVDFRKAFEGDPRDISSFGCYAPVVADTAIKCLAARGSTLQVSDLTGTELTDLFSYLDDGVPVIVWGTLNCEEGFYSVTWEVNGEQLTWYSPEHCMVLVGYAERTVWVADPSTGRIVSYDMDLFRRRYEELYRQAVVIK
ncbi:MAG: C39 family peptidase [Blautia sp.]|nr:C39 family peptidase [Blautia sp.]